jgi:folate-dependent phosphoribosylglycinamide formyltransferase PurN
MKRKKVVILAGNGLSTNIVYNSINNNFGVSLVIVEKKENTAKFLKRRVKKLGIITVIGQVLFQALVVKGLKLFSKGRIAEIIRVNNLDISPIPEQFLRSVNSVNSLETINLLKAIEPDLIIVNGTRIISKKVLASVNCPFINTHAGITPKYRGVHGTYWALYNNDSENSGVTVHFVDEGIDTGNIIKQSHVTTTNKDNFVTYPLLQLAEGLKLLNGAISDYINGSILTQKEKLMDSMLWYHPTIWQYLFGRIFKGVK